MFDFSFTFEACFVFTAKLFNVNAKITLGSLVLLDKSLISSKNRSLFKNNLVTLQT
jgi:hypothetical protein